MKCQRKEGTETKKDPVGPSWYKSPCFLFVEKGFSL